MARARRQDTRSTRADARERAAATPQRQLTPPTRLAPLPLPPAARRPAHRSHEQGKCPQPPAAARAYWLLPRVRARDPRGVGRFCDAARAALCAESAASFACASFLFLTIVEASSRQQAAGSKQQLSGACLAVMWCRCHMWVCALAKAWPAPPRALKERSRAWLVFSRKTATLAPKTEFFSGLQAHVTGPRK